MKVTLYPKYLFRSLFVHGRHDFFKEGYKLLYPEYSRHGMTPWQHYVIFGKRQGLSDGRSPSGYAFFPEGYAIEYPDVIAAGEDPWRHYAEKGRAEGRDNGLHPKKEQFFPEGYLAMYPDVAARGWNPWRHYVLHGKKEGRDNGLHPKKDQFFPEGYLAMYPDVAKAGADPWRHYVLYGKKAGRDNGFHPSGKVFFAAGYLAMYPDVAKAGADPWRHYVLYGKKAGRDNGFHPSGKVFFAAGYLAMYPDVAKAGADPWRHYALYGRKEGRDSGFHPKKGQFFPEGYLAMYPDVAKARMDPWRHYVLHGKKEGRDSGFHPRTSVFSAEGYIEMYPDVALAGMDPWQHYVRYGKKEGRSSEAGLAQKKSLISSSAYFDADWYSHYYRNSMRGHNALGDFIRSGGRRNPGPVFCSNEYLLLNPDVRAAAMNPLEHYVKYGQYEGRPVSLAAMKEPEFPEGTAAFTDSIRRRRSTGKRIVSVFAVYWKDGRITERDLYLLKGIREVSDYTVVVGDCPAFREDVEKAAGRYADAFVFSRHMEYDFGSYKRGFQFLLEKNILKPEDDLLFINDSNYGPVYPFSETVDAFRKSGKDFYGLSAGVLPQEHIQSFFYVFKQKVWSSECFKGFIDGIHRQLSPAHVIFSYEIKLTAFLSSGGFTYGTLVPQDYFKNYVRNIPDVPTKWGATLVKNFHYPLIKVKSMSGISGKTYESIPSVLDAVHDANPELCKIIEQDLSEAESGRMKMNSSDKHQTTGFSVYGLEAAYAEAVRKVQARAATGEKIRVLFLVNMPSMFPGKALMGMLREDPRFEVSLYVIPEVRFGKEEMLREYRLSTETLRKEFPFARQAVEFDDNGEPCHVERPVDESDIVCYPSPYDVSYSVYNPFYAASKGILSIHLNYGYFRSKYDRFIYQLDNYNNFWKVFLECSDNLSEYREYGRCGGLNAVVTGCSKLDRLAGMRRGRSARRRPTVLICPHHSISGGYNNVLALSNFERYSELFQELPDRYPDFDFIFRPHPVLFKLLSSKSRWGSEKVESYLARMRSHGNVRYSDEGRDYLLDFAESDAAIQDCGSFLVEYMFTGKPCCYMLKSPNDITAKFSRLGQRCLDNCYQAYEEQDIISFMEQLRRGEDPKREAREKFAREEVMVNYPHATDSIKNCLVREFFGEVK